MKNRNTSPWVWVSTGIAGLTIVYTIALAHAHQLSPMSIYQCPMQHQLCQGNCHKHTA